MREGGEPVRTGWPPSPHSGGRRGGARGEAGEDGGEEFLGLLDGSGDEFDVAGGAAAGGAAIDAMLAGEDEGVGEEIEGDGETAGVGAALEFAALKLVAVG